MRLSGVVRTSVFTVQIPRSGVMRHAASVTPMSPAASAAEAHGTLHGEEVCRRRACATMGRLPPGWAGGQGPGCHGLYMTLKVWTGKEWGWRAVAGIYRDVPA